MLPSSIGAAASMRRQLSKLYVAYVRIGGTSNAVDTATHGAASLAGSTAGGGASGAPPAASAHT